ncbi:SPOR domain-containing protein [Sphingomonas sp. GCM10030256]|uniref:SPOR domain-containing protein n=1 Tax=Sphingomonas sp. GCM10030256 TaxID=3273427 RepID=UPI003622FDF2
MRAAAIIGATAFALSAAVAAAPTVKEGITAWQRGDRTQAVRIWQPLAAAGDADAQFNLAQAYKLGRGVPLDLGQAQLLFERAAKQGHAEAQANLGMLLFQNGNRTAALRWLKSGAEAGDPRALLVYGTALFNGDGVPIDRVRAYAMVSRAAAEGLAAAQNTLAEMDQLIPLPERQKGVAMALQWSKQQAKMMQQAPSPASDRSTPPPPVAKTAAAKVAKATTAKAPRPLPTAAVTPSVTGGWRIQLGAFSQRSGAEALFRKVSPALPGKQMMLVPVGAMTRLQVGPYPTRAAANMACGALAARGQACFPTAGR